MIYTLSTASPSEVLRSDPTLCVLLKSCRISTISLISIVYYSKYKGSTNLIFRFLISYA